MMAVSRSGLRGEELRLCIADNELILRELTGASILITGATGWFGVWLLDVLCYADDVLGLKIRISAVSRDPDRFLHRFDGFRADPRITWLRSDVRHVDVGEEYSHIIHGATDTAASASPASVLHLFETIVEGTRRVIGAAGATCKSVLLMSSGAIYGRAREGGARFSEIDDGGPDPSSTKNAYAEGKRAAEQLGAIAAISGVPVRFARCFAFVGPHMPFDKHFAIGNFIADAVCGRPILIKSDGRPLRSYLYMTDLIKSLLVILAKGVIGRAYNVGSDVAISIEQLAHTVDRVVGGQGVVIQGALSDPGDRYVPDTSRLQNELGCVPEVSLDVAIARTAAWYRAQRNGSMRS